ncbi:MAG TPA: sensor histidine kinase [Sphingomonas sp.]|nr:sensor histidine kinase [Sphingomonas sp.]
MSRFGELDLPDRLSPALPEWATQIGVAVLCLGGAGLFRIFFEVVLEGGAPFALVYPAVLVATLLARWPSGLLTAVVAIGGSWYHIVPVRLPFAFAGPNRAATLGVVIITTAMTLVIAEMFRRAARRAAEERDRQIADRDLFLQEFDHRVKNNFAIVASLLDLQRRRADAPTAEALSAALQRVESIARAHRHLYRGGAGPGAVEMRAYLAELCAALADSLILRGAIRLTCDAEEALLPRDRAVSIGLVVNELVTNAAKHAFAGRDHGNIEIVFRRNGEGCRVTVTDDGVGMAGKRKSRDPDGGLGSRLIDAFARQARGALSTETGPTGTRVTLTLDEV